jgi:phosphoribosylamine-glycine ligase
MKILVLAGGFDQIALIEELKSRGHEILLADYLDNPPAKKYVSHHFQVSTLDEQAIYNLAVQEKIDFITTACTDQALITVACVSEKLGLPCYISADTARNVTNKKYMKNRFLESRIPTAKYACMTQLDEKQLSGFQFPLVIKPVDSNSSKGVIKVMSSEDLSQKFQEAICESRSKNVIVEEFKQGKELSIDVFVKNGQAEILCERELIKIKNRDSFTITQGIIPPNISNAVQKKISLIAQKIADSFELVNSPMLIQLIVTEEEEIFVLEFSARMGGGSKYKTIELLSGINIMKTYVDLILGEDFFVEPLYRIPYAHMDFCYATNGIYDHIEGVEALKENGFIEEFFIYKSKGAKIEKSTTSTDRIMGFLVLGENEREIYEKEVHICRKLKIYNNEGNDMFERKLFPINESWVKK